MILVKYQVYVYKYTTNESFSNTVRNYLVKYILPAWKSDVS